MADPPPCDGRATPLYPPYPNWLGVSSVRGRNPDRRYPQTRRGQHRRQGNRAWRTNPIPTLFMSLSGSGAKLTGHVWGVRGGGRAGEPVRREARIATHLERSPTCGPRVRTHVAACCPVSPSSRSLCSPNATCGGGGADGSIRGGG